MFHNLSQRHGDVNMAVGVFMRVSRRFAAMHVGMFCQCIGGDFDIINFSLGFFSADEQIFCNYFQPKKCTVMMSEHRYTYIHIFIYEGGITSFLTNRCNHMCVNLRSRFNNTYAP